MGNIIECKNINKSYGKKVALSDISVCVESEKIVGLLGANGCGKTTLIKIIVGMDLLYDGEIVLEEGISSKDKGYLEKCRSKISYCSDIYCFNDSDTIAKLLEFYEWFYDDFDKERALKNFSEHKLELNVPVGTFSKGMKEATKVILAMSRNCKLYILDEPFDGMDVVARESIIKMLIANIPEDAAMIISSHNINDIENILDEAIFIKKGKVVLQRPVDQLREESGKSLEDIFKDYFRA